MLGIPFLQVLEHDVHWVLELLIILPDLHGIDEFDQCCEVLFLDRRFIVDIADQRAVQQRLCFGPELVPGFAVALGVGDQCGDELQDILLAVDIGERIVVHALGEVDGVEDLHLILSDGLQGIAALHQDTAFRICHNIGTMHLKQVRFKPESCLTGSGSTDNQDVFVPGIGRILRTVAHRNSFCLCQDYIVLEDGIHERFDICVSAP